MSPIQFHAGLIASLRSFCAAASVGVISVGILVLLGWSLNLEPLKSVLPGLVAMNPATALAFISAGVALWFRRHTRPDNKIVRLAEIFAAITALIGLLKLMNFFGGSDFGIDRLLFRQKLDLYIPPNRMAPNTALNFLLCGAALLFIDSEFPRRFRPAQCFALTAGLISLLAVLGYAYKVLSLVQVGTYIPMALHTALAFAALCIGIMAARPEAGWMAVVTSDSSGGSVIRRLLPAAILFPTILGALRLWGEKAGLIEANFGLALFVVSNIVLFGGLIWFNGRVLYKHDLRRKEVEEALAQERYLTNVMMDNIPDHIYFKDRQSRFLRINKSLATIFNLTHPDVAKGKSDADFFTAEHAQQALSDEQQIISTGQGVVGKVEKETWPDGSITWVSTTKEILRDKNGEVMGTFGLSRDITAQKRAEEQLVHYAEALRVKNEQMEEELKMARELQLAMLPHNFPKIPREARETALEFFSFYVPTEAVSGDFFSIIPLSETSVGIFICDVMGHGVRAALVTAMMRALVEQLSPKTTDPGQLLTQINRGLVGILQQADTIMYATAFYAVADVSRAEMLYANAGHPAPLHISRQQHEVTTLRVDGKKGVALGLFENATYATSRRPLASQDLILLFTDGLFEVEGADDEQYSHERLLLAVQKRATLPAKDLCSELLQDIQEFGRSKQFADDVCLVGAEVKHLC